MKKIILLIPAFFLTGCFTTVPVKMDFPEIPEELKQTCPDLKQTEKGEKKLSKVIEVVTENYSQYYECRLKLESWIEWHKQQKIISDNLK